ncbi:MAG TPA: ATP-binding protein [Bryobacteraceae bacterium]|nr:ATP-binding protein [Bryobacteraceae bacterium]HPT25782.1 ATP-binding protein [Bryobacteraceae bacterium]
MAILPTAKTPPKSSLSDLTVLLYGQTKIGKSSMCSHADNALFLATEPGLNALDAFQVPIQCWEDLLVSCAEIAEGGHPFRTVIVDTVDNAYKFCAEYILRKFKIEHESDLGYGKGYALINNEFQRVLTKLAFQPYGLFLISHAKEVEMDSRTGKITRVVPTLPDKARKIVLGMADMVLFCDLEVETAADGAKRIRRVIRTKPSLHYEAGDRTGRMPETIDLDFGKFMESFSEATAASPAAPATASTSNRPAHAPAPVQQ